MVQKFFKKIIHLDVMGCSKVNNGLLSYLPPHLLHLNLSCCSKISDPGLKVLTMRCTDLRTLNIYGCHKLTCNGLSEIVRLTNLTDLGLSKLSCVGDYSISCVARACTNLISLNINGCRLLTDQGGFSFPLLFF
eukprot:TRINITY_DN6253_c0_g1_i9.p1 TRINITY_DN6253_c0_g1~~TRINITY_DN6253_c0_g1_i9.p1  ORF type:complete len:134 (+),score=14.08 TRINITY_DN6253_c0_g1_i9:436-837(+)